MFNKAVRVILKWEAGYVNDPRDPGGETRFGISKRAYPELDILNLTEQQAIAIYRKDYWDACKCDQLPYPVALVVFDTAVNMGVASAIKMLQTALNVRVDGIIGSATIGKVEIMDPAALVSIYCSLRLQRYVCLDGWSRYGSGWARRVFDIAINAFRR